MGADAGVPHGLACSWGAALPEADHLKQWAALADAAAGAARTGDTSAIASAAWEAVQKLLPPDAAAGGIDPAVLVSHLPSERS